MPHLKTNKAWVPSSDTDLGPDEEVFVIRSTGETFRSFAEYTERKNLYESSVWVNNYTGKTGTYAEALQEEEKAKLQLEKVCLCLYGLLKIMFYFFEPPA